MKYSELRYERVDVEKTRNLMKEYLENTDILLAAKEATYQSF